MKELLIKLFKYGWVKKNDKTLIICGGIFDDQVMKELGFSDYLITSAYKTLQGVVHYRQADAQFLPFANNSFDLVIVNAGLHHCASPHKAFTEMYRVAKKAIIVHEAQDSTLVRLMVKLKLIFDYEVGAKAARSGGFNNTALPNFVYRWSRREVRKTINSYDPTKNHEIIFFSSFRFYPFYLKEGEFLGDTKIVKLMGKKFVGTVISFIVFLLNSLFRYQGNDFAFIVRKDKSVFWPWINSKHLVNLSKKSTLPS